jgi:hypothetical protein
VAPDAARTSFAEVPEALAAGRSGRVTISWATVTEGARKVKFTPVWGV